MNTNSGAPKTPEELEYERLKAEYLAKREQLEQKARIVRRQLVDAMRERKEKVESYQAKIAHVNELIEQLEESAPSIRRELLLEKLYASREVYKAGLEISEFQMRDHKHNYEGINSPAAMEMAVADSSNTYEYRLARAKSAMASSKLILLNYVLPVEVLKHVVFTNPEDFVDPPEPVEEPEMTEAPVEESPVSEAEEAEKTGETEAVENADEAEASEEIEEIEEAPKSLAELAAELLAESEGTPEPSPEKAEEPVENEETPAWPKPYELLTAEYRRGLRAFIDAHPEVKNELAMAFGYYEEAVGVYEEAEAVMRELLTQANPALLRRLTQDGDNLLGKVKGKLFYLKRLPERLGKYPEMAEILPKPGNSEPAAFEKAPSRAATAPLQGNWTRPLGSTAPLTMEEGTTLESVVPQAEEPKPEA